MRVPMKMVFLSCDWTTEPSQSSNSINGSDGVFSRLIFTDDVKERNPIVQLLPCACEHIYHIKQCLSKHFNVLSKGYKEFTGFVYQCLAINTLILLCCSFCQYLHFHFFVKTWSLWNDISFKLRFKSRFFPKEDPSCYLGEGVAVIYSLHTTGARLTRCVSEWLSLGSWQLLPPLLKRQSTLCFSFSPTSTKRRGHYLSRDFFSFVPSNF